MNYKFNLVINNNKMNFIFVLCVFTIAVNVEAELLVYDGVRLASSCTAYDDMSISALVFYHNHDNVTSPDYNKDEDYADLYNRLFVRLFSKSLVRSTTKNFFLISNEVALKFYMPGNRLSGYGASLIGFNDAYKLASFGLLHCYNSTLIGKNEA